MLNSIARGRSTISSRTRTACSLITQKQQGQFEGTRCVSFSINNDDIKNVQTKYIDATHLKTQSPTPTNAVPLCDLSRSPCAVREFHTGTAVLAQDRRRRVRRGQSRSDPSPESQENRNSGAEESSTAAPSSSSIISEPTAFQVLAKAFLHRAEKALEPMKACNDVFIIQRTSNNIGECLTIKLKPGEGQYSIQVNDEAKTLTLISPMSGNYTYVFCAYTHQVIGMDDGHLLEGMIVRDMIRHCHGLPSF